MRSFALATLAAIATAGKVHDFFAESNFICELCQDVVHHAAKGADEELDKIYAQFPKLQELVNKWADQQELINLA